MRRWFQKPYRTSVLSPPWSLAVNTFAASGVWTPDTRRRIYKSLGLRVGNAIIYPGCYFHTADITMARGVILNHGVFFENVANVSIGERTGLSAFSIVLTSTHTVGPHRTRWGEWTPKPVKIGDGCWIGARVMILPGVTIGDGCVIAAGAVVNKDCEPDGLYGGVPARRIRDLPMDEPVDPARLAEETAVE
jgi:maltose O-acetyltransferase